MASLDVQRPGPWRTVALLLVVVVLTTAGLLDAITGPWLSFALLYVAPVLAAAWWLGRGPAILAGIWAGCAWLAAEAWGHRGEPTYVLLWNAGSRLVMLVAMAAMVDRIREDRKRLKNANTRLSDLLTGAERLARTDVLTGLPNRRAFLERLNEELGRAQRRRGPICVAYLDIDNLKTLNDEQGHAEGDEFLKRVAQAIKDTIRASDIAARLGGDEFGVLFADAKRSAVEPLAQRLLTRIRALGERYPRLDLGVSVGMSFFDSAPEGADLLLQRADAAMYQAKAAGKHRFALWTSDTDAPRLQA